jgi:hypothetical protein
MSGKLAPIETASLELLNFIAGSSGTIKLVAGDSWTGSARGLVISVAGEITTMSDNKGLDKSSYFSSGTYDVVKDETFTVQNMLGGARFTNLEIATGSAMIIL